MDEPPEGGEIAVAVNKLRLGRAGRPLGMKAEHRKAWLQEATRDKQPDTKTWDKVVSVIHVVFQDGYIPETLTYTTMVLIPKGGGEYIVIGLIEKIWKFCASIVNSWLNSSILLYDVLHGFRQG